MMTYDTNEIFERMNLQQVRHFLIYGMEGYAPEKQSYCERIKTGSVPIQKRLESIYPRGEELDGAVNDLNTALAAHESVYMELGMKAGARLAYQLLIENDLPTSENGGDSVVP